MTLMHDNTHSVDPINGQVMNRYLYMISFRTSDITTCTVWEKITYGDGVNGTLPKVENKIIFFFVLTFRLLARVKAGP